MPDEVTAHIRDSTAAGRRDARMTRVVALTTLVVLIAGGVQSRHNWPVGVADVIYALAGACIVVSYFRIYRRAPG